MKDMIKSLVTEYESKLLETRHHLHENPELSFQGTDNVVEKLVPPTKPALVELNQKALALGKNYK